MGQPSPQDVYVDELLSNVAIAYSQEPSDFIARTFAPVIPVEKETGLYPTFSKADFFKNQVERRAPSSESAGGEFRIDNTGRYICEPYALHKDVDRRSRANAVASLDPEKAAVRFLTQQFQQKMDKMFVDAFMTTGVWGTDRAGVTSGVDGDEFLRWDQTNSTPARDIKASIIAMKKSIGRRPNTLVVTEDVMNFLEEHSDFLSTIQYVREGIVTRDLIARKLGLERILVVGAIENTADRGQTATMAYVAENRALLAYVNPTPSLDAPSAAYTFAHTGYLGAAAAAPQISRLPMDLKKADRFEGEFSVDMKLVSADCGILFDNCIAA